MIKYSWLLIFFFLFCADIQAQNDDSFDELKSAYLNIENENYKEAYEYFKEILILYPKEPIYNYYVGRCLLFLDKEPSRAIRFLRFAATKEVPDDIYYFLGLAYIKNYQFEKAIENLQWFVKRANKKQLREMDVQNYISMAQNGLYLVKYVKEPLVCSKEVYSMDRFYENYNFKELEGNFVDRFQYFNLKKDSIDENSVVFVPRIQEINDVFYFSALNEKKGDYDIYRITRLTDTSWSEPENLGDVINTSFDENYPYLHSDGSTLYFASKGHYSMGGYDLYRSSWNWSTQEWSEPENLDFPINSPYNDMLFVSSPNKKLAYFASDRECSESNVTVYKLKLNNSEPYIELKNQKEIVEFSKLNVNIAKEESDNRKYSDERYKSGKNELVKIKNKETFLYKSEYDSLLNLAVTYQLKADSLRWIIEEKRTVFDNTEEGQERAKLSNIIIEQEREIYSLQKKADNCYERVREIEQVNLASQKLIYEDAKNTKLSETAKEMYKSENMYVEPVQDSIITSKLKIVEKAKEETFNPVNLGLEIQLPSIYNSKTPIPLNESLPEGILYMIQLGAFSSEKDPPIFNGLTPLSCIKKENSNIRKYFAGKFLCLSETEKSLLKVKNKGFKDAYVVAFYNGKIIPVKNAVKLESKTDEMFKELPEMNQEKDMNTDIELSIIYVLKGRISLSDSLFIGEIKTVLPDNISLYLENNNDVLILLIKSFSTYNEAADIKSKLEAIVNKEIEIHAYFAENQIPLEQAKKITK